MRLAQDAGLHDAVTDRVSLPTDKGVLDPDPVHQRRRPSRAPSPTVHLHLPERRPWQAAFGNLFTAVQATPA